MGLTLSSTLVLSNKNHVEGYSYFNVGFVRQNQGRTISVPTLETQSQDGFYTISSLDEEFQDDFYADVVLLKTSQKNPGWTFITFSCDVHQ